MEKETMQKIVISSLFGILGFSLSFMLFYLATLRFDNVHFDFLDIIFIWRKHMIFTVPIMIFLSNFIIISLWFCQFKTKRKSVKVNVNNKLLFGIFGVGCSIVVLHVLINSRTIIEITYTNMFVVFPVLVALIYTIASFLSFRIENS
jgi:hypothetical protein